MRRYIVILLIVVQIFLSGCESIKSMSPIERAEAYLLESNYNVVEIKGQEVLSFTVKQMHDTLLFNEILVQPPLFKVREFVNEEVHRISFKVTQHPLSTADTESVLVTVWVHKNKVIGGTSSLDTNEVSYGSLCFIDGKSIDDFYSSYADRRNEVIRILNKL